VPSNSAAVLNSEQILLLGARDLMPLRSWRAKMLEVDNSLGLRRILTLFFAFLSGMSAVSTAVMPAILHI
jgi:hypothetical protein